MNGWTDGWTDGMDRIENSDNTGQPGDDTYKGCKLNQTH